MRRLDVIAAVALAGAAVALLVPAADPSGGEDLVRTWWSRTPALLAATALMIVAAPRIAERLVRLPALAAPATAREGYGRLFLLSFSALALELAMIRWIGAEVRALAYFKNS